MSHLHFLNAEILLKGDGTYIPPFHVTWYVFYEKVIAYGALEFMPFPLLNSLTRTDSYI